MKKLIASLIIISFLATNTAYAQNTVAQPAKSVDKNDTAGLNTQPQTFTIPAKLEAEIKASIVQIYGKEHCNEIYDKIVEIAGQAVKNRSAELKANDINRSQDWYKDEIIYMFYTDQFGVTNSDTKTLLKIPKECSDILKTLV